VYFDYLWSRTFLQSPRPPSSSYPPVPGGKTTRTYYHHWFHCHGQIVPYCNNTWRDRIGWQPDHDRHCEIKRGSELVDVAQPARCKRWHIPKPVLGHKDHTSLRALLDANNAECDDWHPVFFIARAVYLMETDRWLAMESLFQVWVVTRG
jgi:hypothetical protein